MDEPLIYTTKGNVPVADVIRTFGWLDTFDRMEYWEEYHLDGELVRRDLAVYIKPVASLDVKQQDFT